MGQFSFLCKCCGEEISTNRDPVRLFLLHNGEVIESMMGKYNGYGTVYKTDDWGEIRGEIYHEWKMGWDRASDLHLSGDNRHGIAAYHASCWEAGDEHPPTTCSEDGPTQGWDVEPRLFRRFPSYQYRGRREVTEEEFAAARNVMPVYGPSGSTWDEAIQKTDELIQLAEDLLARLNGGTVTED